MILVHKPVPFSPALPSHHRRLPSAPAVVVQSTRTPGLLSIIPKGPSPRLSQQRTKAQFKGKLTASQQRTPQTPQPLPSLDIQKSVKPHVDTQEKPIEKIQPKIHGPPTTTSDKSSRGRQNNKAGKDKPMKRSVSLTYARTPSRRQPRQPSPVRTTSQAEARARPVSINSDRPQFTSHRARHSNVFDPFLVSSSDTDSSDSKLSSRKTIPAKAVPPRTAPKLGKPSGKLAHRRQQTLDSPTPSRSIPVPTSKGRGVGAVGLSRSAPVNQGVLRPLSKRSATDMFPICDDMTDIDGEVSRPTTPARKPSTWQQQPPASDDGPKTAPLSAAAHGFPFNFETPSPSPAQHRHRRHARAPSEGVFNMSLDEDSSASSDASEELKALFVGMLSNKRQMNRPSKEELCRTEAERAAYFASSMFQNSPSPDDLPAPAFMQ